MISNTVKIVELIKKGDNSLFKELLDTYNPTLKLMELYNNNKDDQYYLLNEKELDPKPPPILPYKPNKRVKQTKGKNIQDCFKKNKEDILRFKYNFRVPF